MPELDEWESVYLIVGERPVRWSACSSSSWRWSPRDPQCGRWRSIRERTLQEDMQSE